MYGGFVFCIIWLEGSDKMIKIIFSDFDNTMLNYYSENNYFDEYKISIFKRLRDKGIKFCIVTGRGVSFFERFPNLLEVIDYIAGSNGSCIYDVRNKKYLFHEEIDSDILNGLIAYLIKNNYSFILNCKELRYRYGDMIADDVIDYDCDKDYSCEQVIVRTLDNETGKLFNHLENVKDIGINNIATWNGYFTIDINKKIVSKGWAIRLLCDYLNIDVNDAMAFGDGVNDKSMFEVVSKGMAVGNAVSKLKTFSKDVVLDCKNDGMYKYIEKNILK